MPLLHTEVIQILAYIFKLCFVHLHPYSLKNWCLHMFWGKDLIFNLLLWIITWMNVALVPKVQCQISSFHICGILFLGLSPVGLLTSPFISIYLGYCAFFFNSKSSFQAWCVFILCSATWVWGCLGLQSSTSFRSCQTRKSPDKGFSGMVSNW